MNNRALLLFLLLSFITSSYTHAIQHKDLLKITGLDYSTFKDFKIDTNQPVSTVAAELLHALEQSGYILATVTVTTKNNLHIDLGHINKITINGFDSKVEKRARAYLQIAIESPPHIHHFDRVITLINDLPGVSASLAFERNPADGGYEMILTGNQHQQSGAISLDSTPRNLFKQNRANLQQDFYNVLTGGDIVRFQGAYIYGDDKPKQRSIYGSYQRPVGHNGAYAEICFGDVQSETLVRGASTLAITKTGFSIIPGAVTNHSFEGKTASLTTGYPLMRKHDRATYLLGNIDYTTDKTEAVGKIDSWSGDVSLFQSYQSTSGYSLVGGITLGGGYTDSFINRDDGKFSYIQAGLGYIKTLDIISPYTEVRIETFGQIATKKTPNSKIIGLGGTDFLRGYESSTFAGVSGFIGTVELAHAYSFSNSYLYRVTPFIFCDFGYVVNPPNKKNTTTRPNHDGISSWGVGGKMIFARNLQLTGYIGIPILKDFNGNIPTPRGYLKLIWSW